MGKRKKKVGPKASVRKKTPKNKPVALPIQRPLALVAQVEQAMRAAIVAKVFPGGRLPTLVALADQLQVSPETVRLALDSLQEEGLLVKRRRRGTYVIEPEVPRVLKAPRRKVIGYLIEEGFLDEYDYNNFDSEVVSQSQGRLILAGAVREAGRHNYQVLMASSQPIELSKALVQMNEPEPLSGMIIASVEGGKLYKRIVGRGIPAVVVDHEMNFPQIGSIRPDSNQNARLAIHHLVELGHRNIACAQWRQSDLNPWFLRGYRQGLRDENIKRRPAWEIFVELNERGAAEALDQLMHIPQRPSAIICFHNTFASQLVAIAIQRGLRIPEDLSVIGAGGEEVTDLTCTQLDWQGLGQVAVEMLLKAIEAGGKYKAEHRIIPYELRAGKTTAAI